MNIPNLPVGPIIKSGGDLADEWLTFFQNLITLLQTNIGESGFVVPTQDAGNVTTIQNATQPDPSGGLAYTCSYGTGLYNETANSIMFAVNNGSGAPIFKTVTLT